MKKLVLSTLLLSISSAFAQSNNGLSLEPNSDYFSLKDIYYSTNKNDLGIYNSSGFYQRASAGNVQRIFLLPQIVSKNVQYIDYDGNTFNSNDEFDPKNIQKIQISLSYNGNIPTNFQKLAILKEITHSTSESLSDSLQLLNYDDKKKTFENLPPILNSFLYNLPPIDRTNLIANLQDIKTKNNSDNLLINSWSNYSPSTVSMNNFVMSVLVDGENLTQTKINNTIVSQGTLPNLYINHVTPYLIKRIKNNNFQIQIDYSFRDTKLSSIHSQIDYKRVISKVIQESRKMNTNTKSSGFQFLGFGSRKQSMSQSIQDQLNETFSDKNYANTNISIDDADDNLIKLYESIFFPKIEESEVISRHLAAAEKATNDGKKDLATAHQKYAEYLSTQNPDLKVNTEKALAALGNDDYIGFIAEGFKAGSVSGHDVSDYVRVLNFNSEEIQSKILNLNKTVSVQRTITQFIEKEQRERNNYSGLCGFYSFTWNETVLAAYVPPGGNPYTIDTSTYNLVTCVVNNSPLQKAGILPGAFIYKINNQTFKNSDELINALNINNSAKFIMATPQPAPMGIHFSYSQAHVNLGQGTYKESNQ